MQSMRRRLFSKISGKPTELDILRYVEHLIDSNPIRR